MITRSVPDVRSCRGFYSGLKVVHVCRETLDSRVGRSEERSPRVALYLERLQ